MLRRCGVVLFLEVPFVLLHRMRCTLLSLDLDQRSKPAPFTEAKSWSWHLEALPQKTRCRYMSLFLNSKESESLYEGRGILIKQKNEPRTCQLKRPCT
jgi:hypothetical protein